MRVTGLYLYPVKSLGGRPVAEAAVEPQGLAGDRRWCVIDDAGAVVTARKCHELLRITAEVHDEQSIRLTDRADDASILVATPVRGRPVPVSVSGLANATPADPNAGAWISERIGRRVSLAWQHDSAARPVSAEHGGQTGEVVSLADTGPLLLATESSLAQLNEWIAQERHADPHPERGQETPNPPTAPLDMLRFRPNVVVDGAEPFAEDAWDRVLIGDVLFRKTELCDRCVMTTLDPVTLAKGKEPIRTLARHRRWDGATWFAIRLTPLGEGTLHLGDPVVPSGQRTPSPNISA